MKININDVVRVKLLEKGIRIYREYYGREPLPDSNGFVDMQLWDVMNIFGSHFTTGFDIPIATEIEVKPY